MDSLITIEDGFQYSVNIEYDLNDEKKIKSFIPTKFSLKLIEEILLSTKINSTDRARVLVGAYGKGKSHIVLAILSLLNGIPIEKFQKLSSKIQYDTRIKTLIYNYQESETRLLPVLITGTGTSISQSFLLALQRTLSENRLLDLMPETNFKAAVKTIERWEKKYKTTFYQFEKLIDEDVYTFITKLKGFNNDAYKKFESIYPSLTSGGNFNPFLGFDVTEIYESVVKSLKETTNYSGIYVVYDEFSKYLETNITSTSVEDTKMLQDFAEKCNRSASEQLHLMLICHKEISNYIDTLPKQKVDGWRGISERFTHIHLNNSFTQTYEIIESVILKNQKKWNNFFTTNKTFFDSLVISYKNDNLFQDLNTESLIKIFSGCYPLHPVSLYILPRLSEKVAQNERTLFTFLSSKTTGGLVSYLQKQKDLNMEEQFNLITPDILYDYFEPLLKKEVYTEDLYKTYSLTTILLDKIVVNSLEAKIIKTLSLIYSLGSFERLSPVRNTIQKIYSSSYPLVEIDEALKNLVEKDCIVYQRRSNNFYALKQSSGIDISAEILKEIKTEESIFSIKEILNSCTMEKALYPLGYNDEKEITRYFPFTFICEDEIKDDVNWELKISKKKGDGIVYAIIRNNKNNTDTIIKSLKNTCHTSGKCVFIIPKNIFSITEYAKEYKAVKKLYNEVDEDSILKDEYEVILDDLQEVIRKYINVYIKSEESQSIYVYEGKVQEISRRADLTKLLSSICFEFYSDTPLIINEAVNKDEITTVTANARNKIILALLRNELEKNLGLTGGQELSIMRSLLTNPGIVDTNSDSPKINLYPSDKYLVKVLTLIRLYFIDTKEHGKKDFSSLYSLLMSDKEKLGLRKGIIPVYIACVLHKYKKQVILYYGKQEIPLTLSNLMLINQNPEKYFVDFMDWGLEKDTYIEDLSKLFSDFVLENEKNINNYEFVFNAIRRWYLNLPTYTKNMKQTVNKEVVPEQYLSFLKQIKQNTNIQNFLFTQLNILFTSVAEIEKAKKFFDTNLSVQIEHYRKLILLIFLEDDKINDEKSECKLGKILFTWASKLPSFVFDIVFADETNRFLQLCKLNSESDVYIVKQIALISSGLSIDDWNDSPFEQVLQKIKSYKVNAELEARKETRCKLTNRNFMINNLQNQKNSSSYEIKYLNKIGENKTKYFDKTEISSKGRILSNSINNTINGMGLSITDGEKRQILIDILLGLCGEE